MTGAHSFTASADDMFFIKLSGFLNVKVDISKALMGYDFLL